MHQTHVFIVFSERKMIDYHVQCYTLDEGCGLEVFLGSSSEGLFTLDQGCGKPACIRHFHSGLGVPGYAGRYRSDPISLGTGPILCEADTVETKHQKTTIARFTLLSR